MLEKNLKDWGNNNDFCGLFLFLFCFLYVILIFFNIESVDSNMEKVLYVCG